MSTLVPLVPNAKQSAARSVGGGCEPTFNTPVRWTLRVLAWLAFGIASYLAWHSMTQTAVAGCTTGSNQGCDLVLSSSYSRWLGIPVAVLGLACYATLAALSVMLGLRSCQANRWISTLFVTLSIAAAGVSMWFIGVQIFALGNYCPYCLVTDSCGIVLGVIAIVFAVRSVYAQRNLPQSSPSQAGLMALRSAIPGGAPVNRTAPPVMRVERSSPWLIPAISGAVPLVALLIGGQLLFASKTYDLQKVALKDSITMVGSKTDDAKANPSGGKERVVMRVPSDDESNVKPSLPNDSANAKSDPSHKDGPDSSDDKSAPGEPTKKRLVTFLGGKLTLDVYQHPVIGNPEAPHIVVEIISYNCPHCRKMYPIMEHALERYGDQVALLIMVQPLEKECNRLVTDSATTHPGACATARLAMGIAHISPSSFATFHDFLMSTKNEPPSMQEALPKAYILADRDRLRKFTQSDEPTKQLNSYVDLYETLQQRSGKKDFGLPVQILGDQVMNGSVEHEEDVFKAWEKNLGVKPK